MYQRPPSWFLQCTGVLCSPKVGFLKSQVLTTFRTCLKNCLVTRAHVLGFQENAEKTIGGTFVSITRYERTADAIFESDPQSAVHSSQQKKLRLCFILGVVALCDPKGSRAFLQILSTEGRGVGLRGLHQTLKDLHDNVSKRGEAKSSAGDGE